MATHATSQLTWRHKAFGRRVGTSGYPYFTISHPSHPDDTDARRRRNLAELAGL